ncbi:MAG: uroporphyrinogen-III synthase [Gammaproteobacteria bacterium]|nr:uroporphyrinogen-III synthase [Gammaproteobacteria bacterium]MYG96698.1 uroporphyrinogen-III synthase [Gammaproteobacteria bacterium]
MNEFPLEACRVLVTRPAGQQQELIAAIEALGGEAISLPLLAIEPIRDAGAEARLRENLSRLQDYDLLIFVSVNASRFGVRRIAESGEAISPNASILAVGAATAREAASLLDRPVHGPVTGGGSEILLELPQLEDVKDRRVAIFRGQGGRELLAAELRRRGAVVDYFEVYRRTPAAGAAGQLKEILSESPPDAAVITSAESLARWRELLGEIAGPAKSRAIALPLKATEGAARYADRLLAKPVVVPSRRVAELAAQHGFTVVIDVGDAAAKAMVEALAAHWRRES